MRRCILGGGGCAVLGTVVWDKLVRHCSSDETGAQYVYVAQWPHTFIEAGMQDR